jgi:hypothetical protein
MDNNIFPLFLIISGYIIGLGAVTVIDTLGFLGRKSSYWTETTIRAHKVTKPLIWLGIFLILIGSYFYKNLNPYLIYFYLVLILNGLFLSFYVSPILLEREKSGKGKELLPKNLQIKITISFIISFLTWWGSLFLLTKSSLSL